MNNNEILLLKLGEVVLKGLNRRSFEDKLVSNVRRRMKPCGSFQIYIRQSTIYVEPQTEDCDMEPPSSCPSGVRHRDGGPRRPFRQGDGRHCGDRQDLSGG